MALLRFAKRIDVELHRDGRVILRLERAARGQTWHIVGSKIEDRYDGTCANGVLTSVGAKASFDMLNRSRDVVLPRA
jgi:predicted amidohydrolase